MKARRLAIPLLVVLLIGSNAWCAYRSLDAGISYTYLSAEHDYVTTALAQALAVLPVAARIDSSREQVLNAARLPGDEVEPYEKDGYVWIGMLGLRFDDRGRVVAVTDGSDLP